MARRSRVIEEYEGRHGVVRLRYPSRFGDETVAAFRPLLREAATLVDAIRSRFIFERKTATGQSVPTGHRRSGDMWASLAVSALRGKRGDKVSASFSGRDSKKIRNRDKAWWVTQMDGMSILTPSAEEVENAAEGVAANLVDYLADRLHLSRTS